MQTHMNTMTRTEKEYVDNRAASQVRAIDNARSNTGRIAFAALLMIFAIAASMGVAQAQNYEEGVHYERLSKPQPVSTGDNIEIRELFWYGCPHCFEFEPYIQRWQQNKPENATYVPMPALFRKDWEFHARSYYTFEALGMVDKLHLPFFEAIHKDRKTFASIEQLTEFTSKFEIDPALVKETFESFAVETKTRQAKSTLPGYQVTGVPAIIVDGKFRTSGQMAGDYDELLKVIDFLVDKSAEER